MNSKFPIKLDKQGLMALSRAYMNKTDSLYNLFELIQRIEGYEDILIHAESESFVYEATNGQNVFFSAFELAEMLRNDTLAYHGGNIRLLACGSGRFPNGLAQQLSDILQVQVLAPSEVLWVREDGALFVSDKAVLADMWNKHIEVNETGEWKLFCPRSKEA